MNITKEQVEELLPQTVKDTDALSADAKNMFAILLNSLLVSKGAEDTGVLIKDTESLKTYANWRFERMMNAVRELEKYGLITRIPGKKRTQGESSIATKFIFHWDIIDKPIVRKSHEELFSKFKNMKNPGNTLGKCNSNGNINDNVNININDNSNNTINDNTNTNNNDNTKTNNNENSNVNENSNPNFNEKGISEDEYEQERHIVEEHIRQEAKGKNYSEIKALTIPTYNWIVGTYPEHSDRLKRFADNVLYKINREGLWTKPSNETSVIDEYQASLPL